MKRFLLILGIISLIIGVLSLLFSVLNWFGYYNLLDGSSELYSRLHLRMIVFLVIGLVLSVIGTVSFIIRHKL